MIKWIYPEGSLLVLLGAHLVLDRTVSTFLSDLFINLTDAFSDYIRFVQPCFFTKNFMPYFV